MLEKILGTFSSKVLAAGLNFILLLLTTRWLGAEGRGDISLFVTNISFNLLVCQFVGGSALIYLVPRFPLRPLLVPAYGWAVLACGLTTTLLTLTGQALPAQAPHLFVLSVLAAVASIHTMILLGREHIRAQNQLLLAQTATLFVSFPLLVAVAAAPSSWQYYYALYAAYGGSVLLSWYLLGRPALRWPFPVRSWRAPLSRLLRLGGTAQVSNLIQFFNYRLSYYFLHTFAESRTLGIFATAIQLSEAIWIISRSIGLVQYARLVNADDAAYAARLSFRLARLSGWSALGCVLVLLAFPPSLYAWLFGPEFGQVGQVVLTLSPGIVAIGLTTIFAHHFSGAGRYHISLISSCVGLAGTLAGAFLLIPRYGMIGAGLTATTSYLSGSLYLVWIFRKETGFGWRDLWFSAEDFALVRTLLRRGQPPKK